MRKFNVAAVAGLGSIMGLLVLMSVGGMVLAMPMPGPLKIEIPVAEISGLKMYGGTYVYNESEILPVVVQEIDTLECPQGQTITREMEIAGLKVIAEIKMNSATLTDVLIKARSLTASSGSMSGVTLESRDSPQGLMQIAVDATLNDLVTYVQFVSMQGFSFSDLSVSVRVR
ncbi:MAG: hypothetical protein QXO16_04070 [Archaeoglobaceae archaeon]